MGKKEKSLSDTMKAYYYLVIYDQKKKKKTLSKKKNSLKLYVSCRGTEIKQSHMSDPKAYLPDKIQLTPRASM